MHPFHLLILMLLLMSHLGCASVGFRMGAYSRRAPIYPATAVDVCVISHVVAKPFLSLFGPSFDSDAQEGLMYLVFPGSIVDLPAAVAVDTLLLPYDLYKFRRQVLQKRAGENCQDAEYGRNQLKLKPDCVSDPST